jgi:predicted dehydrogenase
VSTRAAPPRHVARAGRVRLGFAGVGWIGRARMQSLIASGAGEVVAIADPTDSCLHAASALEPKARLERDFEALLELELDGIVLATPSALHAAQSLAALERGIAVFCQKPLGCNAHEARAIVDAARRADRLLGVDYVYRHTVAARALRELVQGGALGRVQALQLTFHNAYGPDKPWFYDRQLAGGGCLVDLGSHLVDLALWLLDFPAVDHACGAVLHAGSPLEAHGADVEDFACAQLALSSGSVAQLQCSWRLHAGRDAQIEVALYGSHAGAALRNVNGSFYDFEAHLLRGTSSERVAAPPDDWGGRALVAFARALQEGGRFERNAERFVQVAAVLDAIYRNAASRAGGARA